MEYIYHEKQEGSLCGQHCLNNLLQGQYFTAVDLAEIAQQMDSEEQCRMAEQGTNTDDFRKFMQQPSSNMDDSGMFSIQVLTSALRIWDLSLVPHASSSKLAQSSREDPVKQHAFICNFKEHWFTVRKLGKQWFNLNSLLAYPELISNMYLSLFLKQLEHEGYSIFVLDGALPTCKADEFLRTQTVTQSIKPKLLAELVEESKNCDDNLEAALSASLSQAGTSRVAPRENNMSEEDLKRAIQMSLESNNEINEEPNDLEKAIALSLEADDNTDAKLKAESTSSGLRNSPSEQNDLEKALQHSLNSYLCDSKVPEGPLQPDIEEVRRKRLLKLEKKS